LGNVKGLVAGGKAPNWRKEGLQKTTLRNTNDSKSAGYTGSRGTESERKREDQQHDYVKNGKGGEARKIKRKKGKDKTRLFACCVSKRVDTGGKGALP